MHSIYHNMRIRRWCFTFIFLPKISKFFFKKKKLNESDGFVFVGTITTAQQHIIFNRKWKLRHRVCSQHILIYIYMLYNRVKHTQGNVYMFMSIQISDVLHNLWKQNIKKLLNTQSGILICWFYFHHLIFVQSVKILFSRDISKIKIRLNHKYMVLEKIWFSKK